MDCSKNDAGSTEANNAIVVFIEVLLPTDCRLFKRLDGDSVVVKALSVALTLMDELEQQEFSLSNHRQGSTARM